MKRIDHTRCLLDTFATYYRSEHLSDVSIALDDGKKLIPSHKFVLAARSSYFHALLYGGMRETGEDIIELKETPADAFLVLLKYIYTGELDFADLKDRDAVIDLFMLAHRYGFDMLLDSMCREAPRLLTLENCVIFYEAAVFYQLSDLAAACLAFLDEHAIAFLKHPSLGRAAPSTLTAIFARNTFCAPEVLIFIACERWFIENDCDENERREILNTIRLPLIDSEKLVSKVKESGLFSWPEVSAAIANMDNKEYIEKIIRYGCVPDENIFQKGIHIISPPNLERTSEVARHQLRDGAAGILIEFHKPYLINKIRWKVSATLVDPIQSPFPAHDAFSIEVSLDGTSWRKVVEREQNNNCLLFWSERSFYFTKPQVVQFIHIKGEVRRIHLEREMTYWFQVKNFEAMFSSESYDFTAEGSLLPYFNVASIPFTETTSKDDYFRANCPLELKYKYPRSHRIRGKFIEFTLESLSEINYMKLLLWDEDPNIAYSFVIEVSADDKSWDVVVDRRYDECRGWQDFHFNQRKIFFIRIRGTAVYNCDLGNLFKIVHFECCCK